MQSTPRRCRLPSMARVMFSGSRALGPPRSQGMAPGPLTLVATQAPCRARGRRASQAPRMRSEAPQVAALGGTAYISAESKHVTPASCAASSCANASSWLTSDPNSIVPVGVRERWHDGRAVRSP